MFAKPLAAKSRSSVAVSAGSSSYSPNAFGSPAFGYTLTQHVGQARQLGEVRPHVARAERAVDADAPRPRVLDRDVERVERLARQRAAAAVGDRDRDHQRQLRRPSLPATSWIATIAALALSVSKIVSTSSRSTPPSMRPRTWSAYAAFSWSNVIARNAGLLTSGEIDSVRFAGPIEPATKRGRSGVCAVNSSAAARASCARREVQLVDERLEPVVGLRDRVAR